MADLKDMIYYILKKYPKKDHLSNARLTKIIYLSDWYSAINYNKQISNIHWYFDNYGPFVWDVLDEIKQHSDLFVIKKTLNIFGAEKRLIKTKNDEYMVTLSKDEKNAIKKIIKITKDKDWSQFIKFVYSTYPILTTEKYSYINLENKAKLFKKEKQGKS